MFISQAQNTQGIRDVQNQQKPIPNQRSTVAAATTAASTPTAMSIALISHQRNGNGLNGFTSVINVIFSCQVILK